MPKVLYEVAFAFGAMKTAFSIFTTVPRVRVDERDVIRNVSTGVLVAEDD